MHLGCVVGSLLCAVERLKPFVSIGLMSSFSPPSLCMCSMPRGHCKMLFVQMIANVNSFGGSQMVGVAVFCDITCECFEK